MFIVHSKPACPFCTKAKAMLDLHKLPYEEVVYDPEAEDYAERRDALVARTGHRTFPQVFAGEDFLGGFTELELAYAMGTLSETCARWGVDLPKPYDF